jgi:Putative transposase DNA-binding domain
MTHTAVHAPRHLFRIRVHLTPALSARFEAAWPQLLAFDAVAHQLMLAWLHDPAVPPLGSAAAIQKHLRPGVAAPDPAEPVTALFGDTGCQKQFARQLWLLGQAMGHDTHLPWGAVDSAVTRYYPGMAHPQLRAHGQLATPRTPAGCRDFRLDGLRFESELGFTFRWAYDTVGLPAEAFLLPAALRGCRPQEAVLRLGRAGATLYLGYQAEDLGESATVSSDLGPLGLDPGIAHVMTGWSNGPVAFPESLRAARVSSAARFQTFVRAQAEVQAVAARLRRHTLIGLEGTHLDTHMAPLARAQRSSLIPAILDWIAGERLAQGRPGVLRTASPFTSRLCPECGALMQAQGAQLACACGLLQHRDLVGARNAARQLAQPESLAPHWCGWPTDLVHPLHPEQQALLQLPALAGGVRRQRRVAEARRLHGVVPVPAFRSVGAR